MTALRYPLTGTGILVSADRTDLGDEEFDRCDEVVDVRGLRADAALSAHADGNGALDGLKLLFGLCESVCHVVTVSAVAS